MPASASLRLRVLAGAGVAAVAATFALPRFGQDPAYHDLADGRALLGVPNALDVLSNLPFLAVGLLGLLATRRAAFHDPRERLPWRVVFAGVALTCAGSMYYHLAPTNERLVWDRLPMTVAFLGLLTALLAERVDVRLGARLLAPLVLLGMGTVVFWAVTEARGAGDLRPYALAQAGPVLAVPLVMALFPARYTGGGAWAAAVGLYALAKVAELADRPLLEATGVSGHTMKHVLAAAAVGAFVVMLRRRRPLPAPW